MNVPNKTKGFTIIEVVLVLAIAGLIFLVVFLALPALQRGQRDNQRKQDLGKVMSQVVAYQANNQGSLPTNQAGWDSFKSNYLTVNNTPFADPSDGTQYTLTLASAAPTGAPAPGIHTIIVYPGMACGSGVLTGTYSATSRTLAAVIYQEQGGYACQNS